MKTDRAFYFEMEKSPYFIAETQEELEKILGEHSKEDFIRNCDDILTFYGDHESGNAAHMVAERIIQHIMKK